MENDTQTEWVHWNRRFPVASTKVHWRGGKKTDVAIWRNGGDGVQALEFQQGQGERATFSNLSTKTACCRLAWLDTQHYGLQRSVSTGGKTHKYSPLTPKDDYICDNQTEAWDLQDYKNISGKLSLISLDYWRRDEKQAADLMYTVFIRADISNKPACEELTIFEWINHQTIYLLSLSFPVWNDKNAFFITNTTFAGASDEQRSLSCKLCAWWEDE